MRIGHEPSRFEASEAELVWARHQKDTRSEASRRLIEIALAKSKNRSGK
jgi:hypothetical protein